MTVQEWQAKREKQETKQHLKDIECESEAEFPGGKEALEDAAQGNAT